ncbi:MAG: NPCBM/NEW2 domain-containing protein [Pirellulaceae bacterium]|jgi:hypothetical protein|nr:NPCBM/NEW2 domain-containing protein [Pirellulaceae bacterium]
MRRRATFTLVLFCVCLARAAFAQSYVAVFSDGQRVTGEEISGWNARDATPTLDGVPILDRDRQLRWFQNRSLTAVRQPIISDGFVEFVDGDRLPGRVVGCSAAANAADRQLIVDTHHSWSIPNDSARTNERVLARFVRRICWRNRGSRELAPGQIFLVGGNQLTIRSLRWLTDGVQVLTADGQQSLRFDELAEIHLPAPDPQQVAMAETNSWGNSPMLRIETIEGLHASAPQTTFDATAHSSDSDGDRNDLLDKISRIEKRRDLAAERHKQSIRRQERQLSTIDKDAKAAEKRFASTMKRMEKNIADWPAAKREAWIDRQRRGMVERPRENAKRTIARHKELAAKSAQRVADLIESTSVEMKRLEQELKATSPTGNAANWYHKIHPAWSVDPLWVRFSQIRIRQSFAANETPLTRWRPIRVVQRSTLGPGLVWRSGSSVVGGRLRSAGREFGWGMGVHAENELHFELPSTAKSFRTLVALDGSVGDGGCARASIHLNDVESKPIYQSPILIGSKKVFETGELELTAEQDKTGNANTRTLILVVRQQHDQRPTGADPLDIRDNVNWLEPLITLESN